MKRAIHPYRAGLALALAATVIFGPAPPIRAQNPQSGPVGLDLVRAWLDLAKLHAPGEVDEPVKALRRFSLTELAEVHAGLEALAEFLKEPGLSRLRNPRRAYTEVEQRVLAQLAVAESAGGTANTLLRQIALLHADAMALRGAVTFVIDPSRGDPASEVAMVNDGMSVGGGRMPPLWPIARTAIEALQPRPAADAWARQWYRATTSYLFYSFQLAALPGHLAARRIQIPDDVGAVMDMACLYEAFAGQRVQITVRSELVRGNSINVPNRYAALDRARREYENVLVLEPGHFEARLRRARVTAELGETRRAADELVELTKDSDAARDLRYLAFLFLGEARSSLGELDVAADAYDGALRLYPKAQSPAVGLLFVKPRVLESDLSRIESVLKAAPVDRFDPWLDYHLGPGRHAGAQLDILWRAFIAR